MSKPLVPDSFKNLCKVYTIVIEVPLMLKTFHYQDATVKELLSCALAWSKVSLLFQQFLRWC